MSNVRIWFFGSVIVFAGMGWVLTTLEGTLGDGEWPLWVGVLLQYGFFLILLFSLALIGSSRETFVYQGLMKLFYSLLLIVLGALSILFGWQFGVSVMIPTGMVWLFLGCVIAGKLIDYLPYGGPSICQGNIRLVFHLLFSSISFWTLTTMVIVFCNMEKQMLSEPWTYILLIYSENWVLADFDFFDPKRILVTNEASL